MVCSWLWSIPKNVQTVSEKQKNTTCWKSEGLDFDMLDDDFWTSKIEVLLCPSSHEPATIVCHPSKHP